MMKTCADPHRRTAARSVPGSRRPSAAGLAGLLALAVGCAGAAETQTVWLEELDVALSSCGWNTARSPWNIRER